MRCISYSFFFIPELVKREIHQTNPKTSTMTVVTSSAYYSSIWQNDTTQIAIRVIFHYQNINQLVLKKIQKSDTGKN